MMHGQIQRGFLWIWVFSGPFTSPFSLYQEDDGFLRCGGCKDGWILCFWINDGQLGHLTGASVNTMSTKGVSHDRILSFECRSGDSNSPCVWSWWWVGFFEEGVILIRDRVLQALGSSRGGYTFPVWARGVHGIDCATCIG